MAASMTPPVLPKMASLPPPTPVEEKTEPAVEQKPEAPKVEAVPSAAEEDKTETPPIGAKPLKPLTVPAEARPASIRPAAPVTMARPSEAPARELAPRVAAAGHAPASKPLSGPQASDNRPVFVVQMGVFNNLANAEELRAKLELAGIPAQIEARVKVGPFGSREEAEAARKKLIELGLEPGFLTAGKK